MVFRGVWVGAADEDAEGGCVSIRRPDLLTVHDVCVTVARRPGREVGEVGAGVGLGEELAPDLLAGEEWEQVTVLLLLCAGVDDGRARPTDADGVLGPADA